MEQIRIIKEMRENDKRDGRTDEHIRPRWMVWENVCGAFSSNGGEDFRAVLEETARIAEPDAVIPQLAEKQKWTPSGCIMGDGWSIAWRVHDAQFWGVPQRRKRISLVADFAGGGAPEVLFERKSLQGDSSESAEKKQAIVGEAKRDSGETVYFIQGNAIDRADTAGCNGRGWREDVCYTLNTIDRPAVCVIENHPADSRVRISEDGIIQTLSSRMGTGGGNVPLLMTMQGFGEYKECGVASSCKARDAKDVTDLVLTGSWVRRLTPIECERLQGYPDGWTDIGEYTDSKGKKHKDADSPRYKALGNSIALPFWYWLLNRISATYDADYKPTLGSLFDGIAGFPLCWERINGKGTARWASEIEEFCIAVTKKRFGED